LRLTYNDLMIDEAANATVADFVRGQKFARIVNDPVVRGAA